MPGYLVTDASVVVCAHGAPARPGTPTPRVQVAGAPAVLLPGPWTVTGCPLPPPPATPTGPCVTGSWTSGTVRVTSSGQPLVIQGGSAVCAPTGTPLLVTTVQPQVRAS